MLPPSTFLNNPVDTVDQCYLNFHHAPIDSLLKKTLQTELYNEKCFPENSKHIVHPSIDTPSCIIDKDTFLHHLLPPSMPTADSLSKNSKITPPSKESPDSHSSLASLPNNMTVSDNDLSLFSLDQLIP